MVSKKLFSTGLLLLLVFTLFPLFILSFYNHPWAEDINAAADMLKEGFLQYQKDIYISWSGRYTTTLVTYLNPLDFHAYWGYKLNAIILILFFLISTYWLTGKLFKNIDRLGKIGITSLFFFSFIVLMPDIGQGIFWMSGSYNCLNADTCSLMLFGCMIGYYQTARKKWYFFMSCLLAVAIIGFYEVHLLFIDLIIALFVFLNLPISQKIFPTEWRTGEKQKLIFPVTLIAVCILFSLISIKAPGNSARGEDYANGHNLIFTLKESISYGKIFLIHWLPFMLFIGVALFYLLYKNERENDFTDSIFILSPWQSLIITMAMPFIGVFLPIYAMGDFPPGRTINCICFYFIVGMFYFSFSVIAWIKKHVPDFSINRFKNIALLILVLQIFSNDAGNNVLKNNITRAYKDIISGRAATYNWERMNRHNYLLNFKGDSCLVDSVTVVPASFFYYELPTDPRHWVNTSFCEYYHKKYIGIKGRKK